MPTINIDPSIKYEGDSQRVLDGEATLKKASAGLDTIGVTRIANITDLDRLGIPVFSGIRPTAADGAISVYSGKGVNPQQARISTIMECYERCLAERNGVNADIDENVAADEFMATMEEAAGQHDLIRPEEFLMPQPLDSSSLIEWTEGFDLLSGKEVYVPSNSVYHPYDAPGMSAHLFRSNTNGLASGNVMEEAILHGLLEVIERDALSMAEFNRNPGMELVLTEEDGQAYEMLKAFRDSGVDIRLWVLLHDTPVTTVVAATDDVQLKDPALLVMGAGSHLRPEIAVMRAITEAAQSRVVQIHGAREDTIREDLVRKIGYERMRRMNDYWYEEGVDKISLADMQDISSPTPAGNINTVLSHLEKIARNAIVVDLSRSSINIPVVRVIIPGFEQYTLDRERVGKRIRLVGKRKGPKKEKPWKRRPKV